MLNMYANCIHAAGLDVLFLVFIKLWCWTYNYFVRPTPYVHFYAPSYQRSHLGFVSQSTVSAHGLILRLSLKSANESQPIKERHICLFSLLSC